MNYIPTQIDGKIIENLENKTFCIVPWVHTYISPQSERRLCCASREIPSFQKQYIDVDTDSNDSVLYNPKKLEVHWNSDYMKDIRVKLMAGEEISQCDVCNKSILSLGTYRSWFTDFMFKHKIKDAFLNTSDDGTTEMEVISFDYRFSNVCNFKCRMCGEQLSSSWEQEKRKNNIHDYKNDPWMRPDIKEKIKKFQINVVENEFMNAINKGIVEEIYWVGGEPLLFDIHWSTMNKMINDKTSSKCYVRYNTNLSVIEKNGIKLFRDILPNFKDYLVCASIDATEEIGEFIRTGLVWNEWLDNFKEGVKLNKNKIRIDLTLTGPGMLDLEKIIDLSIETGTRIETKIIFSFDPGIVLSPFSWPRRILDKILDKNIDMIKSKPIEFRDLFKTTLDTLIDMKLRPTFEEQWPDKYIQSVKSGKEYQNKIGNIRKDGDNNTLTLDDIYKLDQELSEWWSTI